MALIDSRTTRILFTVLLFALGIGFLYVARRTLMAFLFAIFFAYLVDPAVSRVEKFTRGAARNRGHLRSDRRLLVHLLLLCGSADRS